MLKRPVPVEVRKQGDGTAADLVSQADIYKGNKFLRAHGAIFRHTAPRDPHAVPALDRQKPLPDLVLVGVERVIGRQIHRLPDVARRDREGPFPLRKKLPLPPHKILPVPVHRHEGCAGPKPQLLQPRRLRRGRLKNLSYVPGKDFEKQFTPIHRPVLLIPTSYETE